MTRRGAILRDLRCRLAPLLLLVLAGWNSGAADPQGGAVTGGFTMPMFDELGRLRSKLVGKNARSLKGFDLFELDDVRVETFRTNGTPEFVAEAPRCLYDTRSRAASSAGKFSAYSADRKLEIYGTGFVFQQTNSSLVVSNDARTVIRREMTNTPAAATEVPLVITAVSFNFDLASRRAVYRERVRAEDAQMELACGQLNAQLVADGGSVRVIEAERDVVIVSRADGSRAAADRAVYTRTNELVELTGHATWRQGAREGRAGRIEMQRAVRGISAEGEVALKLPREALGTGGFFLTAPEPGRPAAAGTNGALIEVFSDRFRSTSNLTELQGRVRVLDGSNRLSCALLSIPADAGALTVAEGAVEVEQGRRLVTAKRATYARSGGEAVFEGAARWRLEQVEGEADRLLLRQTNFVQAAGNAHIRLLRTGAGGSLLPVFPAGTNAPAVASTNPPVDVFAREFVLRDRVATFTGAVRAHETPITGAEPRLRAEELVVRFAALTNRAESAVARGNAVVEQGTAGVTNGPAAYQRLAAREIEAHMSPGTGLVTRLTADGQVRIEHPNGQAEGAHAEYELATDQMRLTGDPRAVTPELIIREAAALIWDRPSHRFSAVAPYKMEFRPRDGTNSPAVQPGK